MKRFDKVKEILDTLVSGQQIAGHGAFWRGMTIDKFKAKVVFGLPLLVPGSGASSNIIKALTGQAPFGTDIATPGAMFRRMPAGRPPATAQQIAYIQTWIDDGCLDDDDPAVHAFAGVGMAATGKHHNAYWREFDNWAMWQASDEVSAAEGQVMGPLFGDWLAYAKDNSKEAAFMATVGQPAVRAALSMLSARQRKTVEAFYGAPIRVNELLESYTKFGSGTLPPDALRPADPQHQMNGSSMWFFWSAFIDACLRAGIDVEFWEVEARAVLVGLIHDGLFRADRISEKIHVKGFPADANGSAAALQHVAALPANQLGSELRTRALQSGLFN